MMPRSWHPEGWQPQGEMASPEWWQLREPEKHPVTRHLCASPSAAAATAEPVVVAAAAAGAVADAPQ